LSPVCRTTRALLPSLKEEVLLLNSILSRAVRNSGVLGLIAVEDMVLLMDIMARPTDLMVIAMDHHHHPQSTMEPSPLHLLMSTTLHLVRPAHTLLQRHQLSHTTIHDPSLLMVDLEGTLITIEDADTVTAVAITTTILAALPHSLST